MDGWNMLSALLPARWTIGGGAGVGVLLSCLIFLGWNANPHGPQPIAYNHAKHVQSGMSCTDCHAGAETEAHATLPTLDMCMTCHAAALTKSAEEEKLRTLSAAGKQLQWVKLSRVPPHVYFSHRRHVTFAKLSCAGCHGPMATLTAPPDKLFSEMSMDSCIACHEKKRAGTECNDCHR